MSLMSQQPPKVATENIPIKKLYISLDGNSVLSPDTLVYCFSKGDLPKSLKSTQIYTGPEILRFLDMQHYIFTVGYVDAYKRDAEIPVALITKTILNLKPKELLLYEGYIPVGTEYGTNEREVCAREVVLTKMIKSYEIKPNE